METQGKFVEIGKNLLPIDGIEGVFTDEEQTYDRNSWFFQKKYITNYKIKVIYKALCNKELYFESKEDRDEAYNSISQSFYNAGLIFEEETT